MPSVRLCVPKTAVPGLPGEHVLIDACFESGDVEIDRVTASELIQQMTDPVEEAQIAVGNDFPAHMGESIAACLTEPDDARPCLLVNGASIPETLLRFFPDDAAGLLRRPCRDDLLALPKVLIESAQANETLLSLWIARGAHAKVLEGPVNVDRMPAIGPGRAQVAARTLSNAVDNCASLRALTRGSRQCFESGVLLLWDLLDESHAISQSASGANHSKTPDYWHGIMHRREPDLGNAGYWFRRVGRHPAMDRLEEHLPGWLSELGFTTESSEFAVWDPDEMIRRCGVALRNPEAPDSQLLRVVQYLEILNLLAEPWA